MADHVMQILGSFRVPGSAGIATVFLRHCWTPPGAYVAALLHAGEADLVQLLRSYRGLPYPTHTPGNEVNPTSASNQPSREQSETPVSSP